MMGASNPHPHGQIWADESIPDDLLTENRAQEDFARKHGECMLCAYVRQELQAQERVIYANEHACALAPFWGAWPFEALVLPRAHAGALSDLSGGAARRPGAGHTSTHCALRSPFLDAVSVLHGIPSTRLARTPRTKRGTRTRTIFLRCCARPAFASTWSAMKCWRSRSATSRPKKRRGAFATHEAVRPPDRIGRDALPADSAAVLARAFAHGARTRRERDFDVRLLEPARTAAGNVRFRRRERRRGLRTRRAGRRARRHSASGAVRLRRVGFRRPAGMAAARRSDARTHDGRSVSCAGASLAAALGR